MKKRMKAKTSKRSKAAKNEMPELVTVMMRIAERLEVLEKKTDQVISRLSARPPETSARVESFQPSGQGPAQGQDAGRRERVMYKVICADCGKNCEVPFRPGADRPVYCKACFVIRKAGHVPQDPDKRSHGPIHPRPVTTIPRGADQAITALSTPKKTSKGKKSKKQKTAKKK